MFVRVSFAEVFSHVPSGVLFDSADRSSVMNLNLFCCFVGSNTPFPVCISSSYIVDELKEAIRQKNFKRLKDTQADELELFKVSLPDEDGLAQKVEDAVKASKPLHPIMKLLKIFPNEPPEETIHIAVKLPGEFFAFSSFCLTHSPIFSCLKCITFSCNAIRRYNMITLYENNLFPLMHCLCTMDSYTRQHHTHPLHACTHVFLLIRNLIRQHNT